MAEQAEDSQGQFNERWDVSCSTCGATFHSLALLAHHFNDPQGHCSLYEDEVRYPLPPAFYSRDGEEVTGRYHPTSGYIFGKGDTLQDTLMADEYERRREHVMYYPFVDEDEWELAKFLSTRLTQTDIKDFLRLKWLKSRNQLSFTSVDQLLGWIDALPSGPTWQYTTLTVPGCKTIRPIRLMWRDAQEVVKDILRNPVFANYMTFDPHVVMRNSVQEYSEFFTDNRVHHIQDQLPEGATIIPIIISSDKTTVTRHTGALEMHPVFITIGNIQSDVRMQASSYAWRCVGFIPTPEFEVHRDFQTLLLARLFHQCMDMIFASLKQTANTGAAMTDSLGYIRNCFTPLVAYTADLPEQQLIACVSKNASSVTTATLSEFGDPFQHPPRSGVTTLEQIAQICVHTHPWDIAVFQEKAKALKLLGVHLPFWQDWRFANPMYFLIGELLHSGHKFVFDHPLKWCKEAAGAQILDARYKTQHKRVGVRHFNSGISHINQMTGCEHRDIQRTLVPMLVKASPVVTPLFIHCIRSIIEFVYRAQSPTHTDASLVSMVAALHEFHETKDAVLQAGACRGTKGVKNDFNIPKLELFQSFAQNIMDNGALIQYTADVTERLHITHCKIPFKRTNRNASTFVDQVVGLLNRAENIRRFDLYHILRRSSMPLESIIAIEDEHVAGIDPTLSFISRIAPNEEISFTGPRPFRNHFTNPHSFMSSDGAIAFHTTMKPDATGLSIAAMQTAYLLPCFADYLTQFMQVDPCNPPELNIDAWHKFRIQHHSSFRSRYIMKSQVVQAYPRSHAHPLGMHDIVLVNRGEGVMGVAQVKAIFMLKSKTPLNLVPTCPLLFVDFFTVVANPDEDDEGVGLYRVQCLPSAQGTPTISHSVVQVTDVVRSVELIPVFDTKIQGVEVTSDNCLYAYHQYYVNSFADKETFNVICTI